MKLMGKKTNKYSSKYTSKQDGKKREGQGGDDKQTVKVRLTDTVNVIVRSSVRPKI